MSPESAGSTQLADKHLTMGTGLVSAAAREPSWHYKHLAWVGSSVPCKFRIHPLDWAMAPCAWVSLRQIGDHATQPARTEALSMDLQDFQMMPTKTECSIKDLRGTTHRLMMLRHSIASQFVVRIMNSRLAVWRDGHLCTDPVQQ